MIYTSSEISKINSSRSADPGKYYIQDNGWIYQGTVQKTLQLIKGPEPLPEGGASEQGLTNINDSVEELNANTGYKTDILASSDTGTFSLISLFKRLLDKLSTAFTDRPANTVSTLNSSTTPVPTGNSFTGVAEDISKYNAFVVAVKTDTLSDLFIELSPDGTNWDSSLPKTIPAGISKVYRVTTTRSYFRIRLRNDSGVNQTYLRLQCIKGSHNQLTSALNSKIYPDADATTVRPLDFNLMVAEGLYDNRGNTIKDGYTPAMASGAVTQDLWTESGVSSAYTGFPAAAAAAELVVAGADTGTVLYSYMATDTDTDYTFGSKEITGAGTYSLGHNIWRCNFMIFLKNSTTAFNVDKITIRHTATPTTIFCTIETGRSQSYCAAYTVPYKSAIYIDRWQGAVRGGTSGSSDGFVWYREYGLSPRYRFPFELQFGSLYFDDVDYLIKIPARTDIIPRILNNSANNLVCKFTYRFIKVKE